MNYRKSNINRTTLNKARSQINTEMKNKILLHQIKIGTGKSVLFYSLAPFVVVTGTLLFLVIFFPVLFNINTGSNKLFIEISIISLFIVIFVIPCIFYLIGYSSKKLNKKYINEYIKNKNALIHYYQTILKEAEKEKQEGLANKVLKECKIGNKKNLQDWSDIIEKEKNKLEIKNYNDTNHLYVRINDCEKEIIDFKEILKEFN